MKKKLTRRDFVRITAIGAGVLAVGGLGIKELVANAGAKEYSETRPLLGTYITIKVVDDDEDRAKETAQDTFAEISRLSSILSRHDPASELARLNKNAQVMGASSELVSVLEQAQQYSELTDGAFDITVLPLLELYRSSFTETKSPPAAQDIESAAQLVGYKSLTINGRDVTLSKNGVAVTLDGVAKGYIVDKATELLRARGMTRVLVEAGGDLSLSGMREDGDPWKVGIIHPRAITGYYEVVQSSSGCIATSGDYESAFTSDYSYHHIIDPRLGLCPGELASASVMANNTTYADALSTAAMVMGMDDALALCESLPGVEALLIGKDLKSKMTSGFPVASSV